MKLRSDRWLRGEDEVALISRVALRMGGARVSRCGGRPIIALANSSSDLNPCNQPLDALITPLRAGVEAAGGVAVEIPTISLGEDLMKPSAMLYRNLLSMEIEESLRSQPIDGVVILAGCDKTVPGALMGAFSTGLPCLLMVSGPRPVAVFEGQRVGTGTDLWRMWDRHRKGDLSGESWDGLERALALGKGTCNTMGTASSMGAISEAMGLAWPGSTSIPAGDLRHIDIARRVGARIVQLAAEGRQIHEQVTQDAIDNAVVVLCAIGGSTNAVIHLTAMARRLGYDLTLDRFDEVSRYVPIIVDLEPSGVGLMDEFDAAGGVPTVLRELGSLLHPEVVLADGRSTRSMQLLASAARNVVHSLEDPVDAAGAFRVVRGNLAPDGALIKRSAASPGLLKHRGPAFVMRSAEEVTRRTGLGCGATRDSVLVLSGAGPIGGPGMPEWGMIPVPKGLLDDGVSDMVRVTDARMSGTAYGTVFLHVAPEGAAGGAIGLVQDGDWISVDADAGSMVVELEKNELERRRRVDCQRQEGRVSRGYVRFYREHVMQAPEGCDFDFLIPEMGTEPRLEEPVIGRS